MSTNALTATCNRCREEFAVLDGSLALVSLEGSWVDTPEGRRFLCNRCLDPTPRRIRRQRVAGWRMPPGAIYVGRPGRWGNPFTGPDACRLFATALRIMDGQGLLAYLPPPGYDLACWCKLTDPCCHADLLVALANRLPLPAWAEGLGLPEVTDG